MATRWRETPSAASSRSTSSAPGLFPAANNSDNPAAGAGSVAEAMTRILQRRYESLDAAGLRQLCGRYDEMLRAKDVEMEAAIPELLKRVGEADRALAARESRG